MPIFIYKLCFGKDKFWFESCLTFKFFLLFSSHRLIGMYWYLLKVKKISIPKTIFFGVVKISSKKPKIKTKREKNSKDIKNKRNEKVVSTCQDLKIKLRMLLVFFVWILNG